MLDVLGLVQVNEERTKRDDVTWYDVDPMVVFPAVIAFLQENREQIARMSSWADEALLSAGFDPTNAEAGLARMVVQCKTEAFRVMQVPAEDWHLGLSAPGDTDETDQSRRSVVLDTARRWFTEALHQAIHKKPMGVHWLKNEDWRY